MKERICAEFGKWIDAKKYVPKEKGEYLIACKSNHLTNGYNPDNPIVQLCYWRGNTWAKCEKWIVLYWMPKPTFPKGVTK